MTEKEQEKMKKNENPSPPSSFSLFLWNNDLANREVKDSKEKEEQEKMKKNENLLSRAFPVLHQSVAAQIQLSKKLAKNEGQSDKEGSRKRKKSSNDDEEIPDKEGSQKRKKSVFSDLHKGLKLALCELTVCRLRDIVPLYENERYISRTLASPPSLSSFPSFLPTLPSLSFLLLVCSLIYL
jgi:hypothetical protein